MYLVNYEVILPLALVVLVELQATCHHFVGKCCVNLKQIIFANEYVSFIHSDFLFI